MSKEIGRERRGKRTAIDENTQTQKERETETERDFIRLRKIKRSTG